MEFVKKITLANLVPGLKDPDFDKSKAVPLARIFGMARRGVPSKSQYGDYVRFNGDFEGINLLSGETQRSGTCILPGVAESMLFGAMGDSGESVIEFGFEIGIKPSTSPVGYDYTCKPVIDNQESDPMKALREQALKGLPSPESECGGKKK